MRRDRERSRDRERRRRRRDRSESREERRQRKRADSRSPSPARASLGSILRLRSPNEGSADHRSPPISAPPTTSSDAEKEWIETRVAEQIKIRIDSLEAALNEKFVKQRAALERETKERVESALREEVEEMRREKEDQDRRCSLLEVEWKQKLELLEEEKRNMAEERLSMLEEKSKLERERKELERMREDATRSAQSAILNRGGTRQPIRFGLSPRPSYTKAT